MAEKARVEKLPKLKLVGLNGNAFVLLGAAKRSADKAKWTPERWEAVYSEATSGNYDHLLGTLCRHFDVR